MIEEIAFNPGNGVFGVLTRPDTPSNRPAIVLLSAGFIHRPGPFRMHVELARRLAGEGFAVARLDLPGVGDAPAPTDPDDVRVITQALDAIGAPLGIDRFVVGGLCSAADLGWKTCLADPRVCGLILLDGVARRGFWYRAGQAQMLLSRGARSITRSILSRLSMRRRPAILMPDTRDWPKPGEERGELERMLSRDVEVFALYTGGSPDYFTHHAQFRATFGRAAAHPNVHFRFWPDCDHMFMRKTDRDRLIDEVRTWCDDAFA